MRAVLFVFGLTSINLAAGGHADAVAPQPVPINLIVRDTVDIRARTWDVARREVERIFRHAGVRIAWSQAASKVVDIRVSVLSESLKGRLNRSNDGELGVAPGIHGSLAYVFHDRVRRLARNMAQRGGRQSSPGARVKMLLRRDAGAYVLAAAIAHEVGHLLLPFDSHEPGGVMQGHWDWQLLLRAVGGDLRFSPRQAAAIRSAILRRTGVQPVQ